jgi:hypothetical protein
MSDEATESQSTHWETANTWLKRRANDTSVPIVDCYAGKIFHFWRSRNAYQRTKVEHYDHDYAFHPKFADIAARVQQSREMGASWTIVEMPVLVLRGESAAVVIGALKDGRPAGGLADGIQHELHQLFSLGALVTALTGQDSYNVVCFVAGTHVVPGITSYLRQYRSRSRGDLAVPLDWQRSRFTSGVSLARKQATVWKSKVFAQLTKSDPNMLR